MVDSMVSYWVELTVDLKVSQWVGQRVGLSVYSRAGLSVRWKVDSMVALWESQ